MGTCECKHCDNGDGKNSQDGKPASHGMLIAIVLVLGLLAGGGYWFSREKPSESASRPEQKQTRSMPLCPNAVLSEKILPSGSCYITVELQPDPLRRPGIAELEKIAAKVCPRNKLAKHSSCYVNFVFSGMDAEKGAWALATFNPRPQVSIHGMSDATFQFFRKQSEKPVDGTVVGRWLADEYSEKEVALITIVEKDGAVTGAMMNPQGKENTFALEKVEKDGEVRYINPEDDTTDYWTVSTSGNLLVGNVQGIWQEYRKLSDQSIDRNFLQEHIMTDGKICTTMKQGCSYAIFADFDLLPISLGSIATLDDPVEAAKKLQEETKHIEAREEGAIVTILEVTPAENDVWYHVECGGQKGWINAMAHRNSPIEKMEVPQ